MKASTAAALAAALTAACIAHADEAWQREYAATQQRLARGWNTWSTQSVLSHVLLPEGLTVTVGIHRLGLFTEQFVDIAQPGGTAKDARRISPGLHALDGSYDELTLDWRGLRARIQGAAVGPDLLLLVTPLETPAETPIVDIEVGLLWNRPGGVRRDPDGIMAALPARTVKVFGTGAEVADLAIPAATPFMSFSLAGKVGASTGKRRTIAEIEEAINGARLRCEAACERRGVRRETLEAIKSVLGWDTIFDPAHGRVITPVSRSWNVGWGGYVLFDWDTFFAGYMAGLFGRDLAYANAVEILNEVTPAGFVPNYSGGRGIKSLDRSQPPVGALVVLDLYRRFHDRWFLEATYPRLLGWNRWWDRNRSVDGYLAWGSDPGNAAYEKVDESVNTLQGAKYESGLDNSPMYDGAAFDPKTHRMRLADVGLMSLYVADCDALAEIAGQIGRSADARELQGRSASYRLRLATLWSPERGIFLNKNLDTGEFNPRISPTNFYPLIARAATEEQARRMVAEHLANPEEFWGPWVMPASPRNDPAFKDQDYWRGRIWGPMNFLVYLGLRNYDLPGVRAEFAEKSEALLLKDWKAHGHVHENYNALTGEGDDVTSSDPFYHWGGLLGAIRILEAENHPPTPVPPGLPPP